MKALTALCTAERPISNGFCNNCKNSLTVSIYTRSIFLFCWKHLCLMSQVLNMSVLRYCLQIFYCYKKNTLIIDMCVCLLCVEIADTKPWRKCVATNIIRFLSRLVIEIVLIETKDYMHFLSSFMRVNNFFPLIYSYNYFYFCRCYFCCSCCCLVMCFPFLLFGFARYTNYSTTNQLYCYKPVTY